MADQDPSIKSKSQPELGVSDLSAQPSTGDSTHAGSALMNDNAPSRHSPRLSRSTSFSTSSLYQDDSDAEEAAFFPPVEQLTMFDFIENLALSQRVEKIQNSISAQTEKIRQAARARGMNTRDRAVEEWRRRVPTEGEQLDKYKKRMRQSVDRLNKQWASTTAVTAREKASFIAAVMNIFVSGYLVGGRPEWFPLWYSAQLLYFMPIRYYTYQKIGYHYFLADLCYFVNFLLMLSLWVFPQSKRMFISTYCLAFGNNAIAIVMWRNSLVFHSMDKVVSLFIHIMPCVTLHCIVHLLDPDYQQQHYPAIYNIRTSSVDSPHHYTLPQMLLWATFPYGAWQLGYHFLITVRRREKIAAGRPTSFTWLLKSYAKTPIGKTVLALPKYLQEPVFMLIQYSYACITLVPCPIWFWSRWASGVFLTFVFIWSSYNGANYYIEVFGKKFQKELEAMKKDMARWQNSPDGALVQTPNGEVLKEFPPLDDKNESTATGTAQKDTDGEVRERK
ncbi:hypothetical protein P280DRAFT_496969 [Massarina eburnea CBS 473.64]|uniref:Glycerophosphocholine acyltransferase 1 n=1 Tax=Massarina eburnea CBS 473.64 TaxID=1395130 RepID=A0A6A6S644_9PLEO|nr:hypothetical protein P280DRAFT_496969 [Massarina eburnea CBS 473.64]